LKAVARVGDLGPFRMLRFSPELAVRLSGKPRAA
jgi:hypothetical protein